MNGPGNQCPPRTALAPLRTHLGVGPSSKYGEMTRPANARGRARPGGERQRPTGDKDLTAPCLPHHERGSSLLESPRPATPTSLWTLHFAVSHVLAASIQLVLCPVRRTLRALDSFTGLQCRRIAIAPPKPVGGLWERPPNWCRTSARSMRPILATACSRRVSPCALGWPAATPSHGHLRHSAVPSHARCATRQLWRSTAPRCFLRRASRASRGTWTASARRGWASCGGGTPTQSCDAFPAPPT